MPTSGNIIYDCMTWTVMEGKPGVIEVTIRLFFTFPPGTSPAAIAATVQDFKENITGKEDAAGNLIKPGRWSNLHYKCYQFKVSLEIRTATPANPTPAPNELDVNLVHGGPTYIDHVGMTKRVFGNAPPTPSNPLSDSPDEMLYPARGQTEIAISHMDSWAHELGHWLGLDDGYIHLGRFYLPNETIQNKPGHTRDMMVDYHLPVSAQMITRLIRRNRAGDVKCPIKFEATSGLLWMFFAEIADIQVQAEAEDTSPPTDDPAHLNDPIKFKGTFFCRAGAYMDDHNKDFRQLLSLLGANTAPLAKSHDVNLPISFEINPARAGNNTLQPFTIKVSQEVELRGWFFWDNVKGLPVLVGSMSLNGRNTASFFPGPPLDGSFFYKD